MVCEEQNMNVSHPRPLDTLSPHRARRVLFAGRAFGKGPLRLCPCASGLRRGGGNLWCTWHSLPWAPWTLGRPSGGSWAGTDDGGVTVQGCSASWVGRIHLVSRQCPGTAAGVDRSCTPDPCGPSSASGCCCSGRSRGVLPIGDVQPLV